MPLNQQLKEISKGIFSSAVQTQYRCSNRKNNPVGTVDNPEYLIIWYLSSLRGARFKEFYCIMNVNNGGGETWDVPIMVCILS
jgi:hypothetical protein